MKCQEMEISLLCAKLRFQLYHRNLSLKGRNMHLSLRRQSLKTFPGIEFPWLFSLIANVMNVKKMINLTR